MTTLRETISCEIKDNSLLINGSEKFSVSGNDALNFFKALYQFLKIDYPKFFKMDGLSKLGFLAAEAIVHFYPEIKNYRDDEIAIICANRHSSLDTDERYWNGVTAAEPVASPALFVYTLPNIMLGEIAIRHKWFGENLFFVSENYDRDFLNQYARLMLQTGKAKACVAGWVDFYKGNVEADFRVVGLKSP